MVSLINISYHYYHYHGNFDYSQPIVSAHTLPRIYLDIHTLSRKEQLILHRTV